MLHSESVVRGAMGAGRDRYRSVFARAPVALWDEDFSAVETWLNVLRRGGVEDLRSYLEDRPSELERGIRMIRVVDVNEAGVALVAAASKTELLGGLDRLVLSSDARRSLTEQMVAIWEGRSRVIEEQRVAKLDGAEIDSVVHWVAHSTSHGPDYSSVVVAIVDISTLRDTTRSLEEVIRSKDELIASLSHEIRTPLTSVMGYAQLLQHDESEFTQSERRDMIDVVVAEASELTRVVEDLLVEGRTRIGTLQLAHVPVNVRAQVAQVVEALDPDTQARVDVEGAGTALGDPTRVRHIIRNLISNAVRHGGPEINVSIDTQPGTVDTQVIDNGQGIDAEDAARIFDPYFHRTDAASQPSSIGLGLTVSRKLARLMGGDITYQRDRHLTVVRLTLLTP